TRSSSCGDDHDDDELDLPRLSGGAEGAAAAGTDRRRILIKRAEEVSRGSSKSSSFGFGFFSIATVSNAAGQRISFPPLRLGLKT
ncbi:unnamed protein product, partial [Tilletia laevis]